MGLFILLGAFIIAGILGALLVKIVEKHRQEKLGIGEIKFYVVIPFGIVLLIWIFIVETTK